MLKSMTISTYTLLDTGPLYTNWSVNYYDNTLELISDSGEHIVTYLKTYNKPDIEHIVILVLQRHYRDNLISLKVNKIFTYNPNHDII